jgi:mRNA interferase RelE/StbE
MDSFKIEWRKSAVKELRRIDRPIIPRILSAAEQLARDPYPTGTRKLQGAEYTYRIRIGDYRLVYEVDNTLKIITISRIRHRKDVYRR